MTRDSFEMSGGQSSSELLDSSSSKKSGCFVSTLIGFILLIVGIAVVVLIAVIVFFSANNSNMKCTVEQTSGSGAADGQTGSRPGGDMSVPINSSGVWWPDKKCFTDCLTAGYCTDTDSTTVKPGPEIINKVTDVRLPLNLIPDSYTLRLRPDIYTGDNKTFTHNGTVTIMLNCTMNTKLVTLHVNKITVSNAKLKEVGGADITLGDPVYDKARQFVNFTTATELTSGNKYELSMDYKGDLKNDLAGLYWSSYTEPGETNKRYIATTQFQPTDARKAFPCYDEPGLKANLTISVERKRSHTSIGNMDLLTTEVMYDDWEVDHYRESVPMSTYLVAFIVSDFEQKNQTFGANNEKFYRVWARKSAIDQTDFALAEGLVQLEYFEQFFDEPYPLPKVDMIAIPDFSAGAMENWGLITYRETAMLYDPTVSAASNKQRVSVVVSHELAHQWFGNIVTPSWWDDLWLNEGFASYVEYLGVDKTQPDWEMLSQFVNTDLQSTMKADSLATSHPIYVPVNHPDEINEIFDSISYGKGGSLIRMMRFFVGDMAFQNGLAAYINDKKYQAATHKDLWRFIQKAAEDVGLKDQNGKDVDVSGVLDTWLLQMGFPEIYVAEAVDSDSSKLQLKITQSHFLQDDTQQPDPKYPSPYEYKWDVPLAFTSSNDTHFNVTYADIHWFYKEDDSVMYDKLPAGVNWLIVNPKQYGFYRVNYDSSLWNKIIKQLDTDHTEIDPLNRAQVIDDSFNLALAGRLSIEFAMSTTQYLSKETSYFPWDSAIGALDYVHSALKQTEAYGDFKTYMVKLITPLYNSQNNGWVVKNDSTITEQYLQSVAVSRGCRYDIGDCRTKAADLYKQLMDNVKNNNMVNPIHPNLRSVTYCYAVQQGGVAEWDFAFEQFSKANVAAEAIKFLSALGCTDEIWLLNRLLDYAIDENKIRSQDASSAISTVSANTLGKYLAFNWVRAKWEELNEKFSSGIMAISRFVTSVTRNMFTEYELQQIEMFTKEKGDLGRSTRAFAQAKEKTEANIKYLKKNYNSLAAWLANNKN